VAARLIDLVFVVKYKILMRRPRSTRTAPDRAASRAARPSPRPAELPAAAPAPRRASARAPARESKRLALIERVLDAAHALFLEQGYDGAKLSDLCSRAGIAYGTFFNHFDAKRDLLRGLADRALRTLTEKLEALAKDRASLEAQLVFLFEEGAAQLVPNQRDLLGQIWSVTVSDPSGQSDRRFHAAFESFLSEGVARGQVRADVPIETLAEIVGSTFANMTLNWVHLEAYPIRERASAAARFLGEALAPRSDTRTGTGK
jgi:AcrR family transcriptional regulator